MADPNVAPGQSPRKQTNPLRFPRVPGLNGRANAVKRGKGKKLGLFAKQGTQSTMKSTTQPAAKVTAGQPGTQPAAKPSASVTKPAGLATAKPTDGMSAGMLAAANAYFDRQGRSGSGPKQGQGSLPKPPAKNFGSR